MDILNLDLISSDDPLRSGVDLTSWKWRFIANDENFPLLPYALSLEMYGTFCPNHTHISPEPLRNFTNPP